MIMIIMTIMIPVMITAKVGQNGVKCFNEKKASPVAFVISHKSADWVSAPSTNSLLH